MILFPSALRSLHKNGYSLQKRSGELKKDRLVPRYVKSSLETITDDLCYSCNMKSSSASGTCGVCGHSNSVHESETCAVKNCRKKIKVCGSTLHYIAAHNHTGWVVCRPCPDHGRKGKYVDYSSYPVIGKDGDGNTIVLEEGTWIVSPTWCGCPKRDKQRRQRLSHSSKSSIITTWCLHVTT